MVCPGHLECLLDEAGEPELVKAMVQLRRSPAKKTPSCAKVALTEMGISGLGF